jgi:protein-tyrosine-phosphatase
MAEVLLKHALEGRGCSDIEVSSVGTWAYAGSGATEVAVEVMEDMGIDLTRHSSRAAEVEELEEADLVVAMTSVHMRELRSMAPHVIDKTVMLKELAEIKLSSTGEDRDSRLKALLTGDRPSSRRSLDVDDPMGLPRAAYERCARELKAGTDLLADLFCG